MKSSGVWAVLLLPLVAAQLKIGELPGDSFPDPFLDPNSTVVPDSAMDGYCQIILQSPVALPPSEIPWNCICSHCQGTIGPKGDRGDRGIPGRPGSPGPRGPPGFRGAPGFVGRPGIKGQKGDDGVKGSPGLQGLMGPKGGLGFKGEKGDPGLEGPPGDQGPKGDDGLCPDECEASQGPPGPPGPAGPVGLRGIPGADGPKGQKGAQGVSGQPGNPGSNGNPGMKGDQGPEGDCPCTDGVDGEPGLPGEPGPQGEPGEQGIAGEPGLPGEKGDEGMMGMMGPPGPCMPSVKSAFSAALVNSFPSPDFPVSFPKIFYNEQGHYIPTMGIFVAPVNGTYVFSFHLTVNARVLTVGLFHNFGPVLITSDTRAMSIVSQTVVLHMAKGDGAWLQVRDNDSNGMFTDDTSTSTFSGYLLHPDHCEGMPIDFLPGGRGNGPSGPIHPEAPWATQPPTTTEDYVKKYTGPVAWSLP